MKCSCPECRDVSMAVSAAGMLSVKTEAAALVIASCSLMGFDRGNLWPPTCHLVDVGDTSVRRTYNLLCFTHLT